MMAGPVGAARGVVSRPLPGLLVAANAFMNNFSTAYTLPITWSAQFFWLFVKGLRMKATGLVHVQLASFVWVCGHPFMLPGCALGLLRQTHKKNPSCPHLAATALPGRKRMLEPRHGIFSDQGARAWAAVRQTRGRLDLFGPPSFHLPQIKRGGSLAPHAPAAHFTRPAGLFMCMPSCRQGVLLAA